ncbi:MAG TPA: alpha/beta hydrolase [Terriglobales bacterium]|nr:alpha/beta hydrolase [Terriglobales bacterium]
MSPANVILDPNNQWFLDFLKQLNRPQVFEVSLEQARAMHERGQELFPLPKLPAEVDQHTLQCGPKDSIALRILRPENASSELAVIMYFHGGGWVLGSYETYDRFLRQLVNGTGAALVFVEYSLSPEERFPVALEECYAAMQWISENATALRLDVSRLVVAGDSAGGNLSAAVCLLAKERGGPNILGQTLIYPATGASFDTPSFHDFGQGYYLTAEASRWFWHQYAPDRSADGDPHACPLAASIEQLTGLPPALIITGECDVLRDEGEAYARKLMQAGVSVACTRYLGVIHGFIGINALAESEPARAAVSQIKEWISERLGARNAAAAV